VPENPNILFTTENKNTEDIKTLPNKSNKFDIQYLNLLVKISQKRD